LWIITVLSGRRIGTQNPVGSSYESNLEKSWQDGPVVYPDL